MPGSSGRFLRYILNGMITKSTERWVSNPLNHAHFNNIDGGVRDDATSDPNAAMIFHKFYFEDVPAKILATHQFPVYDVINERFPNIGIIVINVSEKDLLEVTGNALLKNKLTVVTEAQVINESKVASVQRNSVFINYEDTRNNLLIINYSDLFQPLGDSYLALKKLEEFTGLDTTETVMENYRAYLTGRERLINKKMKWLIT